eukprot:m.509812 g.509812  ORF g.509812 m.509812 type:complete len:69 (+) comp21889_c0_seq22:7431-7637(+)
MQSLIWTTKLDKELVDSTTCRSGTGFIMAQLLMSKAGNMLGNSARHVHPCGHKISSSQHVRQSRMHIY